MSDQLDATTLLTEVISRIKTTAHTTPALRTLRREYTRRIRDAEPRSVIRLALDLQKAGVVHRFFSDELIANHKGAMEALTRADVEKLGKGMDSWTRWTASGRLWRGRRGDGPDRRRCDREVVAVEGLVVAEGGVVCTTKLNVKGTKGDAKRTLVVCEMLIDDREDMVVKAMSWALRALAQRDPKSTERLWNDIVRGGGAGSAEVGNKLRTGLKSGADSGCRLWRRLAGALRLRFLSCVGYRSGPSIPQDERSCQR